MTMYLSSTYLLLARMQMMVERNILLLTFLKFVQRGQWDDASDATKESYQTQGMK